MKIRAFWFMKIELFFIRFINMYYFVAMEIYRIPRYPREYQFYVSLLYKHQYNAKAYR